MMRSVLLVTCLLLAPAVAAAQERPPSPVEAAEVVREAVAPRRSFVGTVHARQSAVLGSESEGRVMELVVREGASVTAGAPVARLRATTVEIQVRAAKAELELRRQELTELRNGARAEELEQAASRLAAAESELEFARWDQESAERLRDTDSISEDELRRVALRLRVAEETFEEARSALALLRAGPREERIAQAAARVAAQEAAVARLEDDLERHTVRAPFDGVVVAEHTEEGEWLSTGDPVVELMSLGVVDVRVGVVEDQVGALAVGGRAVVTVSAYPGRTFEGTIHAIIPQGDQRTRTFPVEVRVPNPEENGVRPLKPGMFARVSLEIGAPQSSLLVPKDALVLGGPTPIVYAVVPGSEGAPATVRPVPVTTGIADGGRIVVEGELEPGMRVVTRGNERLRPGQPVQVTPPAGAQGGGR